MFLPFEIVVLLILSPFIILIWVAAFIAKLLLRFCWFLLTHVLKLLGKMVGWSCILTFRLLCKIWNRRRSVSL